MSDQEAHLIEKEAQDFLEKENFFEAGRLFSRAGEIYGRCNKHKQAAICFASSAGAWALRSGEKPYYMAAKSYEEAARASGFARDFEYASLLYKHAATYYEKEMDFHKFSECFYSSKESFRKFLGNALFNPRKNKQIFEISERKRFSKKLRQAWLWLSYSFSYIVWGHGEKPGRTIFCGLLLVFASALIYMQGGLVKDGKIFQPGFFDAFYFSMVTFTTVGYGDITAFGINKIMVILELACGLFIVPLFIVALSRKYLRA